MTLGRAGRGALLLAGALVVGCLDSSGPRASRVVALTLVPQFDQLAPQDGVPTDVDSFFIRISNPPGADVTRGVRIAPGQDSIELRVDVELLGGIDTVTVTFQGYNSATGQLLYQGSQSFVLTAGLPTPSTPVNATYVGPGRELRTLVVSPRAAALPPGATVQLTYTGFDTANAAMSDNVVFVRYRSSNPAVAAVDPSGLVTAVANGQARVLVIALADSTIRDTCTVDVGGAGPPAIALSTGALAFADTVGTADPAPQVVNVTNSGGGTLTGLAVGTVSYGAGATGWLTATLGGTTAPTTLAVSVSNSGLAAGTYTATVPVTVSGVSSSAQNLTVTLTLSANPPLIALSPTSVTFTDTLLTANPAAAAVAVTNAGGGTLSGLAVGTISYGAGASGWLSASVTPATAPATLSLQASLAGLSAGSFTATVPVTAAGAANSPQNVTVTLNVVAAQAVAIALTPGFAVTGPGGIVNLSVAGRDAAGNPASVTGTAYTSRATGVATVNASTGVVTAVAGGTAVIVATAQGLSDSILVAVAANGSAVVASIADARAFDLVNVGDTVRAIVLAVLTAVTPEKLGSYNDSLVWNPAVLRYVRDTTLAGDFAAPTVNRADVGLGRLRFGAADAVGSVSPAVALIRLTFVAQAAGATALTQTLSDLTAAGTFLQMLPSALVVNGQVRVQ